MSNSCIQKNAFYKCNTEKYRKTKCIIKNYTNSSISMNSIPPWQIQNAILHILFATLIWIYFHLNSQWRVPVTANTHLPVTFKPVPWSHKGKTNNKEQRPPRRLFSRFPKLAECNVSCVSHLNAFAHLHWITCNGATKSKKKPKLWYAICLVTKPIILMQIGLI